MYFVVGISNMRCFTRMGS